MTENLGYTIYEWLFTKVIDFHQLYNLRTFHEAVLIEFLMFWNLKQVYEPQRSFCSLPEGVQILCFFCKMFAQFTSTITKKWEEFIQNTLQIFTSTIYLIVIKITADNGDPWHTGFFDHENLSNWRHSWMKHFRICTILTNN